MTPLVLAAAAFVVGYVLGNIIGHGRRWRRLTADARRPGYLETRRHSSHVVGRRR